MPQHTVLRLRHQWQFDKTSLAGRVIYALRRFAIVIRLGPENVRDKSLRITVVQRKPAGLNLHHDAMAGQENMVRRGKVEAIEQGLAGSDGLGILQTFAIAATEDGGGNH